MIEMYISVRMGIWNMVLNKYKKKFTSGNILFIIECGLFSVLSFHPNNTIATTVKNINANTPILIDKKTLGFCYIK
jgi:hypothetical protein